MDFKPNKTPAEIINEGAFGGTYFRDIYSGVNNKLHKNSWKNMMFLKRLTGDIIVQIIMISVSINMVLNVVHQ